jgi:hypothetical protein
MSRQVTDPIEIEATLLQRNTSHFSQAQGTPFSVDPIVKDFGYEGTATLE